jgi:hypothetical protein
MQQHNINNTQRSDTSMELNQSFPIYSISIHGCSSQIFFFPSLAPVSMRMRMIQNCEYNVQGEGVYTPFSLSKVKLSNLQLIPI